MSEPNEPTGLAEPTSLAAPEQPDATERHPPRIESRRAHLAGVQDSGPTTTLWLSDERTTMHFPLTRATVPALLEQLGEVAVELDHPFDEEDAQDRPPLDEYPETEPEPGTGQLARWTGWRYSNELVHRIPAKQRIALFAAVLVILLLITLFTR